MIIDILTSDINDYFRDMEVAENAGTKMSVGQAYAYRAWRHTAENRAEMFEVGALPWGSALIDGAMVDFVNTLREAGVETFAVTDCSTSLMSGIHTLFASGCSFVGPCTVKLHPPYWDDETHIGLEFRVK